MIKRYSGPEYWKKLMAGELSLGQMMQDVLWHERGQGRMLARAIEYGVEPPEYRPSGIANEAAYQLEVRHNIPSEVITDLKNRAFVNAFIEE